MKFKNKIYKLLQKLSIYNREENDINYYYAIELMKTNLDVVLLDVRSEQEYSEYHLNGAINIPLYELTVKANEVLQNDKIIIIYCQSGIRSKKAYKILKRSRI